MLQTFRDNLKGTAFFIVVLISIPFALVGIDQIFLGTSASKAELSVNGEDISQLEVERALSLQKQRLLGQYEGLDPTQLDDALLLPGVKRRLISEKALSLRARDKGMGVADTTIAEILRNAETFQVDGRFDRDAYSLYLRQMGYTQGSHYKALTDSLLISQVSAGIAATGFVTEAEVDATLGLMEQQRDYYYLTVPVEELRDELDISDEQARTYYADNPEAFRTEDQVIVDYLELTLENLQREVSIDESMVRARYEEETESLKAAVRTRVEHILFSGDDDAEVQQRIAEVQAKLAEGETFSELAREYSDDLGSAEQGGDLGFVDLNAFPEAFSDAASALEAGEVSAPVPSDSGVHLIRVAERDSPDVPTYEQARERIESELAQELAAELLPEKLAELRELVYNAESLAQVGKDLGLEVKTADAFSRSGGPGIASYPSVVEAAFGPEVLEQGYASEVIELAGGRAIALKLKEFLPSRIKSYEEVADDIRQTLASEKATELVEAKGRELLKEAQAGAGIEALAKRESLPWQVSIDTKIYGGNIDEGIRAKAFAIPARTDLPHVSGFLTDRGDYVILSLAKISDGDTEQLNQAQKDNFLLSLRNDVALQEVGLYQRSLVAKAKVKGL